MQKRRLAAIMFTDIVGYTALMGSDEDKAFDVLRKNREIHTKFIEQFNGTLIKEMGDGMLAQFDSAADAVRCATEIQQQASKELEAKVRIGIHLGDITIENNDVFGDGVNIASRVQSITDPGGIYISETVQKSIQAKSDIQTKDLGEVKLKNVRYQVNVFAIQGAGLPPASLTEFRKRIKRKNIYKSPVLWLTMFVLLVLGSLYMQEKLSNLPIDIPSILIFPPDNHTNTDTLDYVLAGIHTSLIGDIGKIGGLNVKSVVTSKAYKDKGMTLSEIAEKENVDYFLVPSVKCYGEGVCLDFSLFEVDNEEKQIWASDYSVNLSQILNLYQNVTKKIAGEVNVELTEKEEQLLSKSRSVDRDVYDAYLKSQFPGDYSLTSLKKAIEYLQIAIEKDPDWAPLYAGLARAWQAYLHLGYTTPDVASPKIYKYLNKALELDPDLPEALHRSAMIAHLMEWNWDKSEREFLKVLAINPNNAKTRILYAQYLSTMQRPEEALNQGQLAYGLDPLNPRMKCQYAHLLGSIGDCKTSLAVAEEVLVNDPDHFLANSVIAESAYQCGNYERVFEADIIYLKHYFEADSIGKIMTIYKEEGLAAANKEIRCQLEVFAQGNPFGPVAMAIFYIRGNEPDKALDWLEKGFEAHSSQMVYITTQAYHFEPLFDHPRFLKIVEEMNLPLPPK